MFLVDLTFEWYDDTMVFRVFIFIFLFRTNGKKVCLDENDFRQCYSNFFETTFLKVTLCSRFLLNNYEVYWQHILKGTLQLKTLKTWIKICANSFIKTWVNIMKQKSAKVSGKWSVAQKSEPAIQRTLHQNRWHFTYFCTILLTQTNLVFKFNPEFTWRNHISTYQTQL